MCALVFIKHMVPQGSGQTEILYDRVVCDEISVRGEATSKDVR
jgi:hypothetical protein